jgi:hypothetical protein
MYRYTMHLPSMRTYELIIVSRARSLPILHSLGSHFLTNEPLFLRSEKILTMVFTTEATTTGMILTSPIPLCQQGGGRYHHVGNSLQLPGPRDRLAWLHANFQTEADNGTIDTDGPGTICADCYKDLYISKRCVEYQCIPIGGANGKSRRTRWRLCWRLGPCLGFNFAMPFGRSSRGWMPLWIFQSMRPNDDCVNGGRLCVGLSIQ